MTINLNTNPYYDDFDPEKNYVKILFKPGFAVQARELTQLQTALQAQISRFGKHFFKDGSIVLGDTGINRGINWIDVAPVSLGAGSVSASELLGLNIEGSDSGARARVLSVKTITNTAVRVYFIYTNNLQFTSADTITSGSNISFNLTSPLSTGDAVAFTITDSVFFIRDHFVFLPKQTLIVAEDDVGYNKRIGLVVNEVILSENEDETLLDNAQGSSNYSAPGADRYKIDFELVSIDYDPLDIEASAPENFLEINRFVNGVEYRPIESRADYSEIDNMLARRTYDESGDYTTKPFFVKLSEGLLEEEFSMEISPGKAYVRGFEFETKAVTTLPVQRATTTKDVSGRVTQVDFGTYVTVNTPSGYLDYDANGSVNLRNASNATIGTANVRNIEKNGSTYNIYIFNIALNSGQSFSSVRNLNSGAWTATLTTQTQGVLSSVNNKRTNIIVLPDSPIKTLLPSDTSYTAVKKYSTTINGVTVTIPGSVGEQFFSIDTTDYIAVSSTGVFLTINSVTTDTSSITVTFSSTINASIDVYAPVQISNGVQKTKTLVDDEILDTSYSNTITEISLQKSDCYKVNHVILRKNATGTDTNDVDVTNWFEFDNGQRDAIYDYGKLTIKTGYALPTSGFNKIETSFQYFSHSTTSGFCTVDSYTGTNGIDYDNIPTYTSSTGIKYNLRDCIDFRPIKVSGSFVTTNKPKISSLVTTDYEFYLPRTDKLILSKDRQFSVVQGIPSETPSIPLDLADSMTLYVLNIPAWTKDANAVDVTYVDNRRFTMRDIGKLKKKVERLEYYTSLSLLEKQAKDEEILDSNSIERFKNGILVDSFAGHSVGDISRADYSCSIEPETRTLRPRFSSYQGDYYLDTTSTDITYRTENVTFTSDLVTLSYEVEKFAEQPLASRFVNANPYMIANWNGVMTLTPVGDTWIDKTTRPDLVVNLNGENDAYTILADNVNNPASVGVRFNDWQTVGRGVVKEDNFSTNVSTSRTAAQETTTTTTVNNQTTTTTDFLARTGLEISRSQESVLTFDAGERIVDNSIIPFIRPQTVKFSARNMKPNTRLYTFFDGINLTEMTSSSIRVTLEQTISSQYVGKISKIRTAGTNYVFDVVISSNNIIYCFVAEESDQYNSEINIGFFIDFQLVGQTTWINNIAKPLTVEYDDELTTDGYGNVAGAFFIPNDEFMKFRTGEKNVRLSDSELDILSTTAAETKFVAQGWSQSVERTLVSTRVATVSIAPILETNQTSSSSTTSIVVNTTTQTTQIPPPPPSVAPIIECSNDGRRINGETRQTFNFRMSISNGNSALRLFSFSKFTPPIRFIVRSAGSTYTSPWYVGSAENVTNWRNVLRARGLENSTDIKPLTTLNDTIDDDELVSNIRIRNRSVQLIVENPMGFEQNSGSFVFSCPIAVSPTPPTPPSPPVVRDPYLYYLFNNASVLSGTTTRNWDIVINEDNFRRVDNKNVLNRQITRIARYEVLAAYNSTDITYTVTQQGGQTRTSTFRTVGPSITVTVDFPVGSETGTYAPITITATPAAGSPSWATSRTLTVTPKLVLVRNPPVRQTAVVDPVAQTFFVSAQEYPQGIFLNSVDLFFRKKSEELPVSVQLRPVVNGYPSSSTIIPFGISILDAYDVNVSNDASVSTRFAFENIVHLAPGEYSFVVLTNTDEYELWSAAVGDYELTDQTKRINTQPYLGSLFKSQNSTTWTPVQEEDLKFALNKCVFNTNITGKALFDNNFNGKSSVPYDLFYTNGEIVDFADTNIDYKFTANGSTWIDYQIGSNYTLPSRAEDSRDLKFISYLSTTNRDITPIIDIQRLKSTLVQNIVNDIPSNDVTELEPIYGDAFSRYVTRKVELAPGFEGTDLKVSLYANKPANTNIRVYYKVGTRADVNFEDNDYVEMINESTFTDKTPTGFIEYKYKTPYTVGGETAALELGEKFYVFTVKIVMLSSNPVNVPLVRDLRVVVLDE